MRCFPLAAMSVSVVTLCFAAAHLETPAWTKPFPPHRIADNLYYVGSEGLASYLITTGIGNILINSGLESSPALIQASVEELGFKFSDTKILLINHAHWDHDAGSARVQKMTGALYMVMDSDVPVVESGGRSDFQYGTVASALYPATKVDRILHDTDRVSLGGATLTAHKTAGHTKGCTTWTMKATDRGKPYDVVIVCSPNVNDEYKLIHNMAYPDIARDYEASFKLWKSLPCDIFLGAHGDYYGMIDKYAALRAHGPNPFVDPKGYKRYIAEREQAFRDELKKQSAVR